MCVDATTWSKGVATTWRRLSPTEDLLLIDTCLTPLATTALTPSEPALALDGGPRASCSLCLSLSKLLGSWRNASLANLICDPHTHPSLLTLRDALPLSHSFPHRNLLKELVWNRSLTPSLSIALHPKQDLKDFMRQAGEVTYADAHKRERNMGIVDFNSHSDMKNAIEKLDGSEMHGRRIRLVEDKARTSRRGR